MEVTVPVLKKSGDVGKRAVAADHFRRFDKEKVGPAVMEIAGDRAARPEPQFFEIASLVRSN